MAAILVFAAAGSVLPATGFAANTFGGRAQGVLIKAVGAPLSVGDTGALPATGGNKTGPLPPVNVNVAVLKAGAKITALKVSGAGNATTASSELAGLNVEVLSVGALLGTPPLLSLSASVIKTATIAACGAAPKAVSTISGLKINNQTIAVTGQPNQILNLGVGQVILNEQLPGANGIVAHAIHITVAGVADVIVSRAESGIECPPDVPAPLQVDQGPLGEPLGVQPPQSVDQPQRLPGVRPMPQRDTGNQSVKPLQVPPGSNQ